jgi:hypothetical protein
LALLAGINEVARSLVPYDVNGSTLGQVVEGARRLLHPDGIAVLVRDRHGDYVFQVVEGVLSEWSGFTLSGQCTDLLEGLFSDDAVSVFHRKQRTPWAREFLFAAGMTWGAVAPIRAHGRNIGALLVNHGSTLRFDAEHSAALQALATLAGVAVREDDHRAEMEELFISVIVSLTMAIEAKDPYTEGHSVRVAAYSEAIGKQLGLPPASLDVIHRTCLVHDIGKIAVDETILAKRDPLDSHEREKMDMHPQIGESILRPIALLRPLLPGVRSHHERGDDARHHDQPLRRGHVHRRRRPRRRRPGPPHPPRGQRAYAPASRPRHVEPAAPRAGPSARHGGAARRVAPLLPELRRDPLEPEDASSVRRGCATLRGFDHRRSP